MTTSVQKVTCFITRSSKNGIELLLFNHPNAGVQIPAGTVNAGEELDSAARREAAEESGLTDLVLIQPLGELNEPPRSGQALIAHSTTVYSRPDTNSFDWAHFRPGLSVEVLRHEKGFTQVRYEEKDRFIDPQYTTYSITGWVLDRVLTSQCTRHFFRFVAPNPTPDRWSVSSDSHIFELFWAPLNNLPAIVPPQDGWLDFLTESME